jgi:hypothetical protein
VQLNLISPFTIWSDDGEELSYKGLELNIAAFKSFISQQVDLAQNQLNELVLISLEEARDAVGPEISLRSLKDDLTINKPGRSFVRDPRNEALQGYERWLLNRVAH